LKVVIPAAGLGTRFLPATKDLPKEMLPVVDRPTIQYVVEEAVAAGADDILIITGRKKRAIEDHLDFDVSSLRAHENPRLVELSSLLKRVRIHFIRQSEPRGLADAISLARDHVGESPFGVLLGDTINICNPPMLTQLFHRYELLKAPVMAVQEVPREKVGDYGVIEGPEVSPGVVLGQRFLEKPRAGETDSRLCITGAYILTPEIFRAIDKTPQGLGGEVQLADAFQIFSKTSRIYGVSFEGMRYDVGDRFLWLKANLEIAYQDPELRTRLRPILQNLLGACVTAPN